VRHIAGPALALGLLAGPVPAESGAEPPAAEITLKTVKFAGLDEFLQQQRGKVVVIDVWADW
jgi:thiol:disulfide interchange protein